MGLPAFRMKHLAGQVGMTATTTVIFLVLAVARRKWFAQSPKDGQQIQEHRATGKRKDPPRRRPRSSSACRSTTPRRSAATRC